MSALGLGIARRLRLRLEASGSGSGLCLPTSDVVVALNGQVEVE